MYKACPECGSAEDVKLNSNADSYYCQVFYSVSCQSQKCRDEWWPQDTFPLGTGGCETPEQAERAWNNGEVRHAKFSFGGRYTGD